LEQLVDPQDLEFVELVGTTAAPLDLEGWRLEGAVELTCAPGTTLGVGRPLVLVDFDPTDVGRAESFRQAYGTAGSVGLAGPYRGRLGPGGKVIRLLKPAVVGDPETGLTLADRVTYDDQSPWPTAADGHGRALSRAAAAAFGSFASSWSALVPTPGTVQFATTGDLDFDADVDGDDIHGFVQVLADQASYEAAFGLPATMVADADRDGDVDFDDIDDFVAILSGTGSGSAVRSVNESDAAILASSSAGGADGMAAAAGVGVGAMRRHARMGGRQISLSSRDGQGSHGSRAAVTDRVMEAESAWLGGLAVRTPRRVRLGLPTDENAVSVSDFDIRTSSLTPCTTPLIAGNVGSSRIARS
jgi:hypothetical protein